MMRRLFAGMPLRPWLALALLALLPGCSTLRLDVARPVSYAVAQTQDSLLGRAYLSRYPASGDTSGVRLLASGVEAFVMRAALAEAAERTIDMQYYVVAQDATATLLLYRTLLAAQRGVRVRLLLDDIGAAGRDFDLATLAAHPNVQIRIFNPFLQRAPFGMSRLFEFIGDSDRLNRRMHNKLWIADNAVAVIGGRNLGDAYFGAWGERDFADLDVLTAGPVVAEASASFDEYWNSEWAIPISAFIGDAPSRAELEDVVSGFAAHAAHFRETEYAQALRSAELGRELREGRVSFTAARAWAVYDPPGKIDKTTPANTGRILAALRPLVEAAKHEVILVTPYLIPSGRGIELLCALTRRGVDVRVLTNSLASTDVPAVHSGYARYRPRLLACGVHLHELRRDPARRTRSGLSSGASLHAKAIAVDRKVVVVGSMNLDPRSRLSNTEIAITIESPELGEQLAAMFQDATALDQAYEVSLSEPGNPNSPLLWLGREGEQAVRYTDEPGASWWRAIVSDLFGAFVSEELL
ncbi:MAG: phospholipase D family protein [Burkholderiaceae bacterium]